VAANSSGEEKSSAPSRGVTPARIAVIAALGIAVIVLAIVFFGSSSGHKYTLVFQNAGQLVPDNQVLIGGSPIGSVESIDLSDSNLAEVHVEVEQELHEGTTATIRATSLSGVANHYVSISPGPNSSPALDEGAELGLSSTTTPVDIDQFFSMFDKPTRDAIRQNEAGFGNALAGRGPQLNEAIGALRRLVVNGQPVLRTIVAPSTNFAGFWRALEDFSATVAPVAETNASLFVALDRTFAAFARVSRPYIQETIEKGPGTLDAVNADLPALRPFFHDSARFFTAFKPGAKALAETSPVIAESLHAGVPALNSSPVLNAQLQPTAEALVDFQNADGVFNGLDLLIDTNKLLAPSLRFIAPAQTTCNYVTLTFKNLANSSSEGNSKGNWLNFISYEPAEGPNSEGSPASAPANGPDRANHLHFNPFPNTGAPGQPNGCEAGNEQYTVGKTVIGQAPVFGTTTRGQVSK